MSLNKYITGYYTASLDGVKIAIVDGDRMDAETMGADVFGIPMFSRAEIEYHRGELEMTSEEAEEARLYGYFRLDLRKEYFDEIRKGSSDKLKERLSDLEKHADSVSEDATAH